MNRFIRTTRPVAVADVIPFRFCGRVLLISPPAPFHTFHHLPPAVPPARRTAAGGWVVVVQERPSCQHSPHLPHLPTTTTHTHTPAPPRPHLHTHCTHAHAFLSLLLYPTYHHHLPTHTRIHLPALRACGRGWQSNMYLLALAWHGVGQTNTGWWLQQHASASYYSPSVLPACCLLLPFGSFSPTSPTCLLYLPL